MKVKTPEPELFPEFWEVWRPHMRHTDGRGDARKAFRKHVLDGADPQDIVDGARAYIRNHLALPADKQAFIPLAATWINKESYADWCDREREYQRRLEERSNVVQMPSGPTGQTAFLREWKKQAAE